MPGRNLLPNATGDLGTLAGVMASTHQLVDMWTLYGIIQAFTLVLLVARYACSRPAAALVPILAPASAVCRRATVLGDAAADGPHLW